MKACMTLNIILCVLAIFIFSSCGASDTATNEIPDLRGDWKTSDKTKSCHWATIDDTSITVYWYNEDDGTKSLYWAGSFTPPTESGKYVWTSTNDKDQTDMALLASGDDEKIFTYENGVINYSVSIMGATETLKLKKMAEKK